MTMNIGITNARGEQLVAILEALYEQKLKVSLIHDKEGGRGIVDVLKEYSNSAQPSFDVAFEPTGLKINGQSVGISTEERLINVPWDLYHVEIVEDFNDEPNDEPRGVRQLMKNIELYDNSQCDIKRTSVRHIISSPSVWVNPKLEVNPGINLVMNVNQRRFNPDVHRVVGSPTSISDVLLVAMEAIQYQRYSIESLKFEAYESGRMEDIVRGVTEAKDIIPTIIPTLKAKEVRRFEDGKEYFSHYEEFITGSAIQTPEQESYVNLEIIAKADNSVSTEQLHAWFQKHQKFSNMFDVVDDVPSLGSKLSIVLPETKVVDDEALGDGKACFEGFGPYRTTFQIKVFYDSVKVSARNQALLTRYIIHRAEGGK